MRAALRLPLNIRERASAPREHIARSRVRRAKYRADYSSLEKIEEGEHENPNQIDEVPEKAGHFHTIGQMFRVVPIDAGAGRKHHITKNEHAAEDVRPEQAGDGSRTRAMRTQVR